MFAFTATALAPAAMPWTVLASPSGGVHWNHVVVVSPPGLTLPLSVAVVLVTLLAARVVAVGAAAVTAEAVTAAAVTDEDVAAADMRTVAAMTDTTVSGTRMCLMIFIPFPPIAARPGDYSPVGRT